MAPTFSPHGMTLRTILLYLFFICIGVAFITYIFFQARFLIAGPEISIRATETTAQMERVITLEGIAKNITRMTLNGRQIYTDTSGNFKEALVLENGYTIATLQAEDRYGRITRVSKEFVFDATRQN